MPADEARNGAEARAPSPRGLLAHGSFSAAIGRLGWSARAWALVAAVVLLGVGTSLRLAIAARHVESPMIDENEVVEQAVAFMGDNQRFYFLKYGPLTMYVLAGIYRLAALLHGTTALEYASRVFLEGSEHYLIARFYVLLCVSLLALFAFASFRRHHGAAPALLVLSLLAFPFLELLAPGARIDYAQAAFQCGALLALSEVTAHPARLRYWVVAGACAGFGIATKPLPGLLLAPCFVAAAWLASRLRPDGTPRPWLARLGATVGARGPWLAALAALGCAALGNPELLDIQRFITSQREAIELHSGNALYARQGLAESFFQLRRPFVYTLLASAVVLLARRDRRALLPALFILVYLAAFYGRASRSYFLVAPAAAGCLLVGHAWVALRELAERWSSERWRPWIASSWLVLAALVLFSPVQRLWSRSREPSTSVESRRWIHENIPSGTRLFYIGWRPSGPQLVATNEKIQSSWGDHFDYGRHHYPFLKQAFHLGFENYAKRGHPRYALTVFDDLVYPRSRKRTPHRITDGLLKEAQRKKIEYIILAGYREKDWRNLAFPWFSRVEVEKEFGKTIIFRVPAAPPPAAPSSTAAAHGANAEAAHGASAEGAHGASKPLAPAP